MVLPLLDYATTPSASVQPHPVMRHQRTIILTTVALLATAPAYWILAQPGPLEQRFNQMDLNHDGVISGKELETAPILHALDLNGDGTLTKPEALQAIKQLKRAGQRRMGLDSIATDKSTGKVFQHLDKNQDAQLDRTELADSAWFERLDTNKDGLITLSEAVATLGETVPDSVPGAPPTVAPDPHLKEQPQLLKADEHLVGHRLPDLSFLTRDGQVVKIKAEEGKKATVLLLFSATCPISNKLGPELARLEKDYSSQGVQFFLINSVPDEQEAELTKFVESYALQSPLLQNPDNTTLAQLRATTTTEVFVIDAAQTLVYRGAINDQYGLGYSREAPRQTFLRDALSATLKGELPQIAASTAPGCALSLPEVPASAPGKLTYHRDISRILQSHCLECHRNQGIAPFPLETLADVTNHAGMIRKQVERGAMPPWFASDEEGHESPWSNDRSLTEEDKTALLTWLQSDRSAGDPSEAPLPRRYAQDWNIGQPDTVLQIPKPIAIKAEGVMPYQTAIVTTDFPEDRWVQSYEIMPTARQVVHHVIVRVHPKGAKVRELEEGADGFWAAYVPGNSYRMLPDGFAKRLPAGATLSFQIHYTPNGRATEDQLKIALRYASKPPNNEVHVASVFQPRLAIPAGASDHVVTAQQRTPADAMITSFMAHMHVRGKAFKYEVTYPDKRQEVLLDIPRYDFNWQLQYLYKQPKFIPKNSLIKITAVFDNSAANPANPDPTQLVRWGAQTYDEMMIGYIEHYTPLAAETVAAR